MRYNVLIVISVVTAALAACGLQAEAQSDTTPISTPAATTTPEPLDFEILAIFELFGEGKLLVTDPNGKRSGFKPGSDGEALTEIPNSEVDLEDKIVFVPDPIVSTVEPKALKLYTVDVSGAPQEEGELTVDCQGEGLYGDTFESSLIIPPSGNVRIIMPFVVHEDVVWIGIDPTSDNLPPNEVESLGIVNVPKQGKYVLAWTAPGAYGNRGTASAYDIRWMAGMITEENWPQAIPLTTLPFPSRAGDRENLDVTDAVAQGALTFALKTSDETGNVSPLSMVAWVDSDSDNLPDYRENFWNESTDIDPGVILTFDPHSAADALADPDGDGLKNLKEYRKGTNPGKADTDGDGMPDGWEVENYFNPLTDDSGRDPDDDDFTNLQEYKAGTNPNDYKSYPTP